MARTPEWSVFNIEDGLVHRLCPRDSAIGTETITCIACIASPMEPT